MSASVFFFGEITPEKGNQNFRKPEFRKPVIAHVGDTVVECNTACSSWECQLIEVK